MATQQEIIDQLIDYIDRAILKNSVSNRHVASVLAFLNETLKENKVDIDALLKHFLSKTKPDRTNFLLELFGGISFKNGYGIDSIGKAKLNSLEADYLKIQELIFNRVSAQEGDTSFSESGVIESVELLPDGTYNLILRKRHETDFTAFGLHDIAYGSVNDLLSGGGNYYSSWFRILSVDIILNSINVILYPDNEVPGGKNSAPEPLMVITRRGNVVNPKRQSYFFLSSSEGRLVRLNGVTKPILEDYNYASSLGSTPDLAIFDNLPINKNQDYLYARGAIIQDLIRVDIEGKPVYEEIARGIWSLQVASSEEPYYFEGYNEKKQRNETSTVYNRGSKWQCLRTGTLLEPAYGSPDWAFLEGNGEFTIGFDSSRGFSFFYGRVDTVLEARFYRGYTDVTDTVMSTAGTVIKWSRHSGLNSEDKSWTPTFAGLKNQVRLTDKDMPSNWLQTRVAVFKIEIEVPQGRGNYQNATKEIGIKI